MSALGILLALLAIILVLAAGLAFPLLFLGLTKLGDAALAAWDRRHR